MNTLYKLLIFLIIVISGCQDKTPEKIPLGEWKYRLFLNGVETGTAIISNKIVNGHYISKSEYRMKMADMTTETIDKVTETLDFKPLKLESYCKVVNGNEKHETKIISVFNERNVKLTYGDEKSSYAIARDFIIDGNYFMSKLIEGKFEEGMEAVNYVYNPSVELDVPIKVTTRVKGFENIKIMGNEKKLLRVVQAIENIKDNIDLYLDEKGILQKGIIRMMNLKIELIKY